MPIWQNNHDETGIRVVSLGVYHLKGRAAVDVFVGYGEGMWQWYEYWCRCKALVDFACWCGGGPEGSKATLADAVDACIASADAEQERWWRIMTRPD